jgi:hypothetical protein
MEKGIDPRWIRMIKGDDPPVTFELLSAEMGSVEYSDKKGEQG